MTKSKGGKKQRSGWNYEGMDKVCLNKEKKNEGEKRHKTFHSGDIKITINFYSGLINVPNIVLNTLSHAILRTSQ